MEKDYSLLRPFDLEAAKLGEKICYFEDGQLATFVGLSDQDDDDLCVRWEETLNGVMKDKYAMIQITLFRMAPLAWVEGRPVYKGDVLYGLGNEKSGIAKEFGVFFDNGGRCGWHEDHLGFTWQKPKTKREGWVNVYRFNAVELFNDKESADKNAASDRFDCVKITWEE